MATPTPTHIRLLVDDYADCFRFYEEVVGLTATFGDADSGYADFDTGELTLALFDREEMLSAVGDAADRDPGDRAAVVLQVDDVEAGYEEVGGSPLATRVAPPADRPEWGIRTAHLRDPDGTLVELNEPLEG